MEKEERKRSGRRFECVPSAIECNCGLIDPDIAPGRWELTRCFICSDGTHLLVADQAFKKWEDIHPEFRQWLIEDARIGRDGEKRDWLKEARRDFKMLTSDFWERRAHWSFERLAEEGLSGRWCGCVP